MPPTSFLFPSHQVSVPLLAWPSGADIGSLQCLTIQKLQEAATLRLASRAMDFRGVSGHAMLTAPVQGETEATTQASLAKGRL
jgi:hypothetical protein